MQIAFHPPKFGRCGVHGVHPGRGQPPHPAHQLRVSFRQSRVRADGARHQPHPEGQHHNPHGQVHDVRQTVTEDQGVQRVAVRRTRTLRQHAVPPDEAERNTRQADQGHRQQISRHRRSQQRDGSCGEHHAKRPRANTPVHHAYQHHHRKQRGPAESTRAPQGGSQEPFHAIHGDPPARHPLWTRPYTSGMGKHLPGRFTTARSEGREGADPGPAMAMPDLR